jgi:filamentous hemagglutinin
LVPSSSEYAHPDFEDYYLGPLPYVPAHVIWWDFGDSGHSQAVGDTFTYSRHSPVWAHFGMAAPTWDAPGQMPGASHDSEGHLLSPADPQAVAAWQAQAAPWVELTARVASFKTAVEAQFLRFDAHSSYIQTTQRAVMTSSEPARISSGGAMTLNARHSLLNQDSEIVAGGALSITGVQVANQATQVSAPTSRSGTLSSWGVTGSDCGLFGCDPEYGWIQTPYAETVANTVPLPALRFEAASHAAPTPALAAALSALSVLNPDPTSGPVFETAPRFTDERQWLSSDHLLRALAVDPATVQKRLGDGFIEQRLIREQVGALTGQRFLGDFSTDEAQYLALMNAGITFAQAQQLRPGIALSAEQVAALTSDIVWLEAQTITLPDGGTTQALVPRVYLLPLAGDLSAGGALIAGRDVQLNLSGDALNSGTIAGRGLVQIGAQNILNTGLIGGQSALVRAREDVNSVGGTVSATDALLLQAGRDLNVQTTTALGSGAAGVGRYRSEQVNRVAGLYVSKEAGVLLASAGRDVNLSAAVLQAGSVDVRAGRDLNLASVNTSSSLDATSDARNFARAQQGAEVGTQIQGDSITLQAGQDITTRAANVQAQGALAVSAGRDITLNAGEASYQIDHGVYAKSSGLLGSSSTETKTHNSRTDAVASSLGGTQVVIHGGRDISLTGSSAVADDTIAMTAGRDVNITAAQTRSGHSNFVEKKRSGLFGSGGGITLGSQQHSTDQQTRGTGAAASTVGAVDGDVNIVAGRTYTQTGSDVLAPGSAAAGQAGGGDITVQAQAITITEARTTERNTTEERFKQSGLTLSLSNPVIDALQGAASTAQALGNTGDGRTQALGLAVAALQGKQVYDAAQSIANNPAAAAGIGINISLGSSKSESNSEVVREGAHGASVVASGDVSLIAGGAGSASNVRVQGSTVEAGDTARLKAEGDIHLVAATETTRETNSQSSKSGSVGIGFNVGGAQTGFSINASASRSKGQGTGEETTHSNTHVQAGQRVELESGTDTTVRGAVVTAPNVQARIGGDLIIESLQDRATYSEKSESASAGVSLCIPPLCFGASSISGGAGKTEIDSTYASVREQSAIRAGDGGFDVATQGKTKLVGGAITSTQAAVDVRLPECFNLIAVMAARGDSGDEAIESLEAGSCDEGRLTMQQARDTFEPVYWAFAQRQGLTPADLVLAATLSTAVAAANCRPAMGLKATTHLAHYSMLEASKTAPGPRPTIAEGKAHLHKLAAILPPLTWSRRFALWLKP